METINTSGNTASGSSGSVTYSIGQVFYTYIGESVYNVAQGVQQQENLVANNQDVDANKGNLDTPQISEEPKAAIVVFPNPTTDYVTINMKGFEFGKQNESYQLYDYQGRLLEQNTISQSDTQINLSNLSSSIYILQVFVDNQILKTFKILKK